MGSARSIEEINIYELIKECSGKLLKFGGHSQAAGLSLKKENLEDFVREIEIAAEKRYFIKDTIIANVDIELSFKKYQKNLLQGFKVQVLMERGFISWSFILQI